MNEKMTRLLFLSSLAILLILPLAFSQETTAGFQGVVKDPSGAVVAGATLEISSPALIGTRKTTTDTGGNYRFAALPPGDYTLSVTATGFRTHKQTGIELAVGRLPNIDIQLAVGAVAETVVVSGAAPIVDTTQSKVAISVTQEMMDALPKGRSFESMIQMAPGSRNEPLQGGYQVDGASDGENVFMVDGVNTTNIQNGGSGKSFQMDFIKEVQVKSSSFEAEFGGALGGVVNAVPKQGSNSWSGSLVTYYQNQALNANNGDRALRTNPNLPSLNTTTRTDATPEYYYAKPDTMVPTGAGL